VATKVNTVRAFRFQAGSMRKANVVDEGIKDVVVHGAEVLPGAKYVEPVVIALEPTVSCSVVAGEPGEGTTEKTVPTGKGAVVVI